MIRFSCCAVHKILLMGKYKSSKRISPADCPLVLSEHGRPERNIFCNRPANRTTGTSRFYKWVALRAEHHSVGWSCWLWETNVVYGLDFVARHPIHSACFFHWHDYSLYESFVWLQWSYLIGCPNCCTRTSSKVHQTLRLKIWHTFSKLAKYSTSNCMTTWHACCSIS